MNLTYYPPGVTGNEPEIVGHDEDEAMLEALESEFMECVKTGNMQAIQYALCNSDHFYSVAIGTISALLHMGESTPGRAALIDSLSAIAPQWAKQEYPKRHHENLEMVDEWSELDRGH